MSKLPLLFLPGLLCDAQLWKAQAEALSNVAVCTIADLTRDNCISAMAERALSVAPPRFCLAALSMGGYVAFEMMRQAPERVLRLALLDTSAAPDSFERQTQRQATISSLQLGRFAGVTSRLLPRLVHASHVSGAVGDEVRTMAARVGGEAFLRQQTAILGRTDSRPVLSAIKVPTLVAVGDSDVLTPIADALEIHENIAGSTFMVIKDCGHLPALERPEETSQALLHWLRSTQD
jgi:pimeloyl-ACP methyl ester carboxylesterase